MAPALSSATDLVARDSGRLAGPGRAGRTRAARARARRPIWRPANRPGWRLPIGIGETDLARSTSTSLPIRTCWSSATAGSGKSAFLRTLAASITARFPPDQARIVLIDYRRSMLGEIDTEHLIGYATSRRPGDGADRVGRRLHASRLPGPDVTPAQLKTRSWWTGPECFVLVDD